jgi:DNA replication protein DnaC
LKWYDALATDILQNTSDTVYRLPRALWHCQLHNFNWKAVKPRALQRLVTEFLEAAEQGQAPHLLLTGKPGIGKTHLSVGIYRWMVTKVGTLLAIWVDVPSFCDEVKASYGDEDDDPLVDYAEARRLVVLDDLFGRPLTSHETEIVYRLIDLAHQNGAALVTTMNHSLDGLKAQLEGHEQSRLLANSIVIPMVGDDWRTR